MVYDIYDRYQVQYRSISGDNWRYVGLYQVKYVIHISDMWYIWYDIAWRLLSWCILYLWTHILCGSRTYVRILYHTSTRGIRNIRTPAGTCCLLLSCCRAALIRNERVTRAFARGDERATAAVAFDIDQRRQWATTVFDRGHRRQWPTKNQSHGHPINLTGDELSSEPARAVAGIDKGLWQPNKRAVAFYYYWRFF